MNKMYRKHTDCTAVH